MKNFNKYFITFSIIFALVISVISISAPNKDIKAISPETKNTITSQSSFYKPTGINSITSTNGRYYDMRGGKYHYAMDFGYYLSLPQSEKIIYASAAGRIIFAGGGAAPYSSAYGNLIVIDHGSGYTTLYGHLSRIDVKVGDIVYTGQTIGLEGETGNSYGSHLHFEIRKNNVNINTDYMEFQPIAKPLSSDRFSYNNRDYVFQYGSLYAEVQYRSTGTKEWSRYFYSGTSVAKDTYYYDTQGYITSQIRRRTNGTKDWDIYFYYGTGKTHTEAVRQKILYYNAAGTSLTEEIRYRSDGSLHWRQYFYSGTNVAKDTYYYDNQGQAVSQIRRRTDGTKDWERYLYLGTNIAKDTYYYNNQEQKISQIRRRTNGTKDWARYLYLGTDIAKDTYYYDNQENIVSQIRRREDGTKDWDIYFYSGTGTTPTNATRQQIIYYDTTGTSKTREIILRIDESKEYESEYTNGVLTKKTYYNTDGTVDRIENN